MTILYIARHFMSIISMAADAMRAMVMTMGAIDAIQPRERNPRPPARFGIDSRSGAGNLLSRLWQLYCKLASKRRSRLALDELSTHLLDDIGVSEKEARRESAVPFWR
ncbi:DUF1127 domain-containing protein [Sinorhizobium meliloti]|uniref:DUF1127 domain-containing protein n=1 Tax=Rhizobium meliloti TaxID=382 RepID=UPI002D78B6B1|nr:DUF1127 domain-containing protein [Sinorhizobium meliloti]WRQ66220.1 DUF1127 domain-containing protein [Sinorhizobium meliloti]